MIWNCRPIQTAPLVSNSHWNIDNTVKYAHVRTHMRPPITFFLVFSTLRLLGGSHRSTPNKSSTHCSRQSSFLCKFHIIGYLLQLLIISYSYCRCDFYLVAFCVGYFAYFRIVHCIINQRVCHRLVCSQFVGAHTRCIIRCFDYIALLWRHQCFIWASAASDTLDG